MVPWKAWYYGTMVAFQFGRKKVPSITALAGLESCHWIYKRKIWVIHVRTVTMGKDWLAKCWCRHRNVKSCGSMVASERQEARLGKGQELTFRMIRQEDGNNQPTNRLFSWIFSSTPLLSQRNMKWNLTKDVEMCAQIPSMMACWWS